jgi:15-cis-phytoene desaturase
MLNHVMTGGKHMPKIIVAGGGLAGLASAALLCKAGYETILFEKMTQIGGRATVLEKDGFRLNFGAHAVYGRDKSFMQQTLDKLGIELPWCTANAEKVRYVLPDGTVTTAPISPKGILETKLLPGIHNKLDFLRAVLSIMFSKKTETDNKLLGEWVDSLSWSDPTKEFLIHLAGTNFFTKNPRELELSRFRKYYHRVLRAHNPVSYINGGWGKLIQALEQCIVSNGGQILPKSSVSKVLFTDGKVKGVLVGKTEYEADAVLLCVPPSAFKRMLADTPLFEQVSPYMTQEPNTVFVYDVALSKRIRNDISYVNDLQNHIFITDPSLYDSTCVPPGGQLLQSIAYITPEEAEDENVLAALTKQVEDLYDKFYAGWREQLAFTRVTERATVQVIGWRSGQMRLPTAFRNVGNCFFAGDWCEGEGSVSDIAFYSALHAVEGIVRQQNAGV